MEDIIMPVILVLAQTLNAHVVIVDFWIPLDLIVDIKEDLEVIGHVVLMRIKERYVKLLMLVIGIQHVKFHKDAQLLIAGVRIVIKDAHIKGCKVIGHAVAERVIKQNALIIFMFEIILFLI